MTKKDKEKALALLKENYPDSGTELVYSSPYELLVSTILAAQCTDKRVNIITKELYKNYNTPEKMVTLSAAELENYIRSCGFYNNKAKNILAMSHKLLDEFGGIVPNDIETLQTLPGVGRKTANVVASVAYGVPAIAVDTHVLRVSNRIGLAKADNVLDTEKQLMQAIPKKDWSDAHHWILIHGRRVCSARSPKCSECPLLGLCDYSKKTGC